MKRDKYDAELYTEIEEFLRSRVLVSNHGRDPIVMTTIRVQQPRTQRVKWCEVMFVGSVKPPALRRRK